MKNILAFISLIIIASCSFPEYDHRPVIVGKHCENVGYCHICSYYYDGLGRHSSQFNDSCQKYNIGDTIR